MRQEKAGRPLVASGASDAALAPRQSLPDAQAYGCDRLRPLSPALGTSAG